MNNLQKLLRQYISILGILTLCLAAIACESGGAPIPGAFSIGDSFRDFYSNIGGQNIFGPPISVTYTSGNVEYQYVSAGLMFYDPARPPANQFGFYPLATEYWNISSIPDPPPVDASIPYINGHAIWEDAWLLYNRLGSNIVGPPLTGVIANEEKQRYEQYYSGLGFYRNYGDPPAEIHLMPYGEWVCRSNCTYYFGDAVPPLRAEERPMSEYEQIFLGYAERPGYAFTGSPIKVPQIALDGYVEMAFENVIMYFDPQNPYPVMLRPLPLWLGTAQENPTMPLNVDWVDFFETDNGLGYDIPVFINDFIVSHGGFELVGKPITHFRELPDGGYQQCFLNMCIEYHPSAPASLRVRAVPLGSMYLSQGSPLRVMVNLKDTNFPSNSPVDIEVYALQNAQVIRDIMFDLKISLPTGDVVTYYISPDSQDGISDTTIPGLDLPQGSRVSYEVCAIGIVGEQECATGTFTIWGR